MASMILLHHGIAMAQTALPYKPTRRGGGGTLKLLWWQGPVHLNPHWATGTKEQEGSRMFYEPLAGWDAEGNLMPVLAAEIPSLQNGGLAADGKSVTWKLKRGVTWHDGQPFTADDVVFNWEFCKDPATSASVISTYRDIRVTKIDSHTVRVVFDKPTPFWAEALGYQLQPPPAGFDINDEPPPETRASSRSSGPKVEARASARSAAARLPASGTGWLAERISMRRRLAEMPWGAMAMPSSGPRQFCSTASAMGIAPLPTATTTVRPRGGSGKLAATAGPGAAAATASANSPRRMLKACASSIALSRCNLSRRFGTKREAIPAS